MKRVWMIALGVVLAVSLAAVSVGIAGAYAQDGTTNSTDESVGNESIEPGEQLTGVVGVQEAEVDREVTERAYGVKLANATTDEERADVVGEQLEDAQERIDDLDERLEELEGMREAGEITEGRYRAEVAKAEAERATVERMAEGAAGTAEGIPEDVLTDRGIDVDAIAQLRDRADELGGPETAEIARSIAGNDVGQSPHDDSRPGAPIGTPGSDDAGNVSDDPGSPSDRDDPLSEPPAADRSEEVTDGDDAEPPIEGDADATVDSTDSNQNGGTDAVDNSDDTDDDVVDVGDVSEGTGDDTSDGLQAQ